MRNGEIFVVGLLQIIAPKRRLETATLILLNHRKTIAMLIIPLTPY